MLELVSISDSLVKAPSYITGLLGTVYDAFVTVLHDWFLVVWRAFHTADGVPGALMPLRPLFVIGIAVIVIFLTIKLIRYIVWGS